MYSGGELIKIRLSNKPAGVDTITVMFGSHGSVTATVDSDAKDDVSFSVVTPAVTMSTSQEQMTVSVVVPSGSLSVGCSCSEFTLDTPFLVNAVPDPEFRQLQPSKGPKGGGTPLKLEIKNLGTPGCVDHLNQVPTCFSPHVAFSDLLR